MVPRLSTRYGAGSSPAQGLELRPNTGRRKQQSSRQQADAMRRLGCAMQDVGHRCFSINRTRASNTSSPMHKMHKLRRISNYTNATNQHPPASKLTPSKSSHNWPSATALESAQMSIAGCHQLASKQRACQWMPSTRIEASAPMDAIYSHRSMRQWMPSTRIEASVPIYAIKLDSSQARLWMPST